jgi:hypothetical protein
MLFEVSLMNLRDFEDRFSDALLCCGVIQTALTLISHNFGKFPITWRLQGMTKFEEADIFRFAKRLMKVCLTREFIQDLEGDFIEEID